MNRSTRMIAMLAGLAVMTSCSSIREHTGGNSQDFVMTGTSQFPSAQGNAKVRTIDNGNTQINLEVKHLAEPEKISPDATAFVVWVKDNRNDSNPQNLGAIKVDQDLHGTLEAITPLHAFDLYVTAEPSATVAAPSGDQLLKTTVEVSPTK